LWSTIPKVCYSEALNCKPNPTNPRPTNSNPKPKPNSNFWNNGPVPPG